MLEHFVFAPLRGILVSFIACLRNVEASHVRIGEMQRIRLKSLGGQSRLVKTYGIISTPSHFASYLVLPEWN